MTDVDRRDIIQGEGGIGRIRSLARAAERRMRINHASQAATTALVVALALATVVIACAKTGKLGDRAARWALALCALLPLVCGIVGWFRRLAPSAGSLALDRDAGLRD